MSKCCQWIIKKWAHYCRTVYYVFLLTFLVSIQGLYAQPTRLAIDHFTINEGLSNNHVTSLYQDTRGYIWVGTTEGLNRYDGYKFKVFRHHPLDSLSIVGNHIQAITETPDGNIWIGTRNSGIAVWDRKTGNFINYRVDSQFFTFLGESNVFGLLTVHNNVWVKTRNVVGMISYDGSEFKKFDHYKSVLKNGVSEQYPIVTDRRDVWFASKDGILTIDKRMHLKELIPENSNKTEEVGSMLLLNDSTIVAGSNSGLWKINLNTHQTLSIRKAGVIHNDEKIRALIRDDRQQLIIGSSRGIMRSQYPYTSYSNYNLGAEGQTLPHNISSLMIDKSQLLWVGTSKNGLYKINRTPRKFGCIADGEGWQFPIDCYDFESVFVDEDNQLWLGTARKGIYRINRNNKQFRHYSIYPAYSSKEDPTIHSIYKDSKGVIWIGTNDGVFNLWPGSNKVREFHYGYKKNIRNLLKKNVVKDIIEDPAGDVWMATGYGLFKYDGTNIKVLWSDSDGLGSNEINALFRDSRGQIWIGTNKGVNVYNAKDGTLTSLNNGKENQGLSHQIVSAFAESNKHVLIGTHAGLSYYDKSSKKTGFWKDDRLLTSKIYGIEVDIYNRIWVTTGKGICSIRPGGPLFFYHKNDGVPDYNFNHGASSHFNYHQLFFGGDKGLTIINADSIASNLNKPNVAITGVEVVYKGKNKVTFEGEQKELTLRYKRNTMISVYYSALEFTYPKANSYRVMLEGLDDDWRKVTHENQVNFSDLSPGKYRLKVTGANNDAIWNNTPTVLTIEIRPQLWMSNYALAFYIMFGVLLLQTWFNYRLKRVKRIHKAEIEKEDDRQQMKVQKEELSRVNQRLTDSIGYAKRIQEAMIPSEALVKQVLPESFIYYRPKDIVSGDFYWTHKRNGKIFLAAVDCTGHGVPGAFMSIIGYDLLKKIVEVEGEECPAMILNKLNSEVANTFKKNGKDGAMNKHSVDDGMDIALITLDEKRGVIQFSGAMNPLYLVRDNEVITFKGDRFPIGYYDEFNELSYSKQEIPYYPNDVVYIFSDGFADQFGGPEGKKFKYRRFRHLLLNIHKLPIEDQKAILHQKMEEWMGTEYEQVDDILLIGFRI